MLVEESMEEGIDSILIRKIIYRKCVFFFNFEKDTTSKFDVFQTKDMENLSFSIIKVNWYNEKNQYILIIVPKCVGTWKATNRRNGT